MANHSIDAAKTKQKMNKQTNIRKKKIFVSVSKSHDDVGYLLDHSVLSSPQRPRLRCTLPFLWPTMYGCCSMYQACYVVLFFFQSCTFGTQLFSMMMTLHLPFFPSQVHSDLKLRIPFGSCIVKPRHNMVYFVLGVDMICRCVEYVWFNFQVMEVTEKIMWFSFFSEIRHSCPIHVL